MVGGSGHHSLYADSRQYPQKEQPVLRSRTVHVSTREQPLYLSRRPRGSEQYQAMNCFDGILVDSAPSWRAEAIENCRFTMIQVWQAEHSATIVRLDSRFAHDDGLQCRQQSEYGKLGWRASSNHTGTEPHFLGSQASKHRSKTMGISNPEIQKKVFGPRWEHEIEKQGWPFWKRLMHRLQDCPICKPKSQTRKLQ